MKDVFDAYKQQKMKKNIKIVSLALLFGIGINVFLPSPTKILSSVTNFWDDGKVVVAKDIVVQAEKSVELPKGDKKEVVSPKMLSLINNAGLTGVTEVRASFFYDANALTLTDFFSEDKDAQIIKMANEPGIVTINVHYKEPTNLPENTKILRVSYEKKGDAKTVVNLAETKFVTENGTYNLSNGPAEF